MKILHICLANFYIEGMGYQENILPAYHVESGYDVSILTSAHIFDRKKSGGKDCYVNDFGATVKCLKNKYERTGRRFRIYSGLYEEICSLSPDIIFVHGGQFVSLKDVIKYCKKNREVKLYIDQHADYYNSPVNSIRSKLFAKCVIGHYMRKAEKYTRKFWGVTPWRCQFLNEIYGISKEKIALLNMGGDDRKIDFEKKDIIRESLRKELGFTASDFVAVTGGKIDKAKNIHLLMRAVKDINNDNIKLVVFGKQAEGMKDEISFLAEDSHIKYIEWLPADKVYDYFLMADLAVFPGTHSVLWEQACACGLPALFKDWVGMRHVNVNGNCEFLYNDSADEIATKISEIYSDKEYYNRMKSAAEECKKEFFYSEIAKKSIS